MGGVNGRANRRREGRVNGTCGGESREEDGRIMRGDHDGSG
jgi:hypothetical protein